MTDTTTRRIIREAVYGASRALEKRFIEDTETALAEQAEIHFKRLRQMGLPLTTEHLNSISQLTRKTYEDWLVGLITSVPDED